MKRTSEMKAIFILVFVSIEAAGCMSTTPLWDERFGDAITQIKTAQILNPDAARVNTQLGRMDAGAAARAQDQYLRSFEKPSRPDSNKDIPNTR